MRRVIAKDRTRHARRREQERVDVSLFDRAIRDIGRAFADVADVMLDFAERYRRLTDEHD